MRKHMKQTMALLLALIMTLGLVPAAGAADVQDQAADLRSEFTPSADAANAIDPEEWVTVIVELKGETTLDVDEFVEEFRQDSVGYSTDTTVAAYRASMVDEQTDIQTQIEAMVPNAEFRYHYTNLLNGFAARVQYKDIEAIKSLDSVLDVYMTQSYDYSDSWEEDEESLEYISLEDYYELYGGDGVALDDGYYTDASVLSDQGSVDQMHLQAAWDRGYTGAGKVIAVFDSSLRYTHELFSYMDPEIAAEKPGNYKTKEGLLTTIQNNADTLNLFDSGWGSWFHQRPTEDTGFSEEVQAAIRNGDFWYNEKVPFAVDYMDGDLEVWDGDSSSHGTHVCGIAAGNPGPKDPEQPVSMDNVNGVLGSAYDAQIMFFKVFSEHDDFGQESDEAVFAALDDAVTLGANAFNLSLGIPNGFTTMNTYAQAGYQKAYNRATAAGISIALSAGNDTRDSRPGALVSGYTTLLPNNSKVGFSGSLFSPMTVASAQGTGYSYKSYYYDTTMTITDGEGAPIEGLDAITVTDNNATAVGTSLTGTYEIVDCGLGSTEEILAATSSETLEGALTGKIALVQRGDLTFLEKGENAFKAGAAGVIMANNADSSSNLSASQIYAEIPTFGMFASSLYGTFQTALESGTVQVSFQSEEKSQENSRTYSDSGPAGSTSWGITEALRLKPDIMAPGGSILSAGAASDTALVTKSGTSMASPNMAGGFLLVQQYVDENLALFGVEPGTEEYNNLVNQLVASTATVYAPLDSEGTGRQNKYFSPRRQGAGLANIDAATSTKVVLHNDTVYNPETGEAPRTKVELFDKLGDTFTFHFTLDNYNDTARTFNVLSCLQTDATTESAGRNNIVTSNSNGTDIDPIEDAVMTVSAVSGDATIDTDSANINRYADGTSAAVVSVPANSSTEITITVELDPDTMAAYDEVYPNGMFLEGYVFFDSDVEDVNIPFLGFRGDWTQAPIFDLATAYDDISALETTDLNYPLYYATTMATLLDNGGTSYEAVLGANQFTEASWPGYAYNDRYNSARTYLSTLRDSGNFSGDYSAISPNGDGFADLAYANLLLLRNAKAICVVITDAEGNVVKTIGPEFEYFEALNSDGNQTQQVAATYGTKYKRNMAWDGTDADGKVVADGQYNYKLVAMVEYEFLNTEGCIPTDNTWDKDNHTMTGMTDAYKQTVLDALLNSETAQSISMPVKVDTVAPAIVATPITDGKWNVQIDDAGGIQALALYYKGERLGSTEVINATSVTKNYDLNELIDSFGDVLGSATFDPAQLELQVVDYAFNLSSVKATESVSTLSVTPANTSVSKDGKLTLTATSEPAIADGAVYQWYKSTNSDGSDAKVVEGATGATCTVDTTTVGTYYYYCVVGGIQSNIATVDVVNSDSGSSGGGSSGGGSSSGGSSSGGSTSGGSTSGGSTSGGSTSGGSTSQPEQPVAFSDISGHWAEQEIKAAVEAGLFTGTSDTTFSPDVTLSRAMFTTVLWRMAGSPAASGTSTFSDVTSGTWYYDAVVWSAANGIVNGVAEGVFDPNGQITREQMAAMLYRYAEFAGKATDSIQPLVAFGDADSVSDWAVSAVAWAVDNGYITGKPGNLLDPQGLASRAEATVIVNRFLSE